MYKLISAPKESFNNEVNVWVSKGYYIDSELTVHEINGETIFSVLMVEQRLNTDFYEKD